MAHTPALLVLDDGTVFAGRSCGAAGEASGEVVFNTALAGYQEIITDPSYAGQIVTMTMPHIGNCGTNGADMESSGAPAAGLVLREISEVSSNWRAEETLGAFLQRHGVVAIDGVDTRKLVRHVREAGSVRAIISTVDLDPASLAAKAAAMSHASARDLVGEVAVRESYRWGSEGPAGLPVDTGVLPIEPRYRVVAIDSGIRYSLLRSLAEADCDVTILPPATSAADVLALAPDGVFLGNGPGDPGSAPYLADTLAEILGKVPVLAVGLGHQVLARAVGAETYRMNTGHHGSNQPVRNLLSGHVEITAQSHSYCVDFGSIGPLVPEASGGLEHPAGDLSAWVAAGVAPVVRSAGLGRVQLTHVNLNDMTAEGLRLLDAPAFSVQYHPAPEPGGPGTFGVFSAFAAMMEGEAGGLPADNQRGLS